MNSAARATRPAVTLIEMLVAMFIVSILTGLLVVSVQRVREAANRTSCQAHLKDLALAVCHHHTDKGTMPPYASGRPNEMFGGWYMHLLPYDGQEQLYEFLQAKQITPADRSLRIATTGEFMAEVKNAVFPNLVCASEPTRKNRAGDNLTNYLANWYAFSDGVRGTYRKAQRFDSLRNGLANAILFAEAYSDCNKLPRLALYSAHFHNFGITQEGLPSDDDWYAPKDYLMFQASPAKCHRWRTQTAHKVMHVALADGSARSTALTIAPAVWKKLLKAHVEAVIEGDW